MTHAPPTRSDPAAAAARLGQWAGALVVWLVETLAVGALRRWARRWALMALARAERGARGIVVLAAMRLLPAPPPPIGRRMHSHRSPRGFARVAVRGNDMRRITRRLFPRERDLRRRAERLVAMLSALAVHAARLARRIRRIMPATRIALVAVMAMPWMSRVVAITSKFDSS